MICLPHPAAGKLTRMFRQPTFVAIALAFTLAPCLAEESANSPSPATQASELKIIRAAEDALLMQLAEANAADPKGVRPTVIVEGTISSAKESETGKVFRAYFKEADPQKGFYFVYFPKGGLFKAMQDKFGGKSGSGMEGKHIRLTGVVELYKGRPQMVVTRADQVRPVE